jgi:hypothetical protein
VAVSLKDILSAQLRWAEKCWPGHQGIRAPSLEDNLIMPMDEVVRAQFQGGAGGEMGSKAVPGKMYSLRSSSALATALGQRIDEPPLTFERSFPHGLAPYKGRHQIPPNLDVAIGELLPLAIECKFTEPYETEKSGDFLKDAYFDGGLKRWTAEGLPECQRMAEALGKDLRFRRLDAAQLLKHLLGIAYSTKATPRLLCLWFDDGSDQAREHCAELEQFAGSLDKAVEFATLSYQEAFATLRRGREPRPGYFQYLGERYFGA